MPAFTEEEMSLISTCNFENKNGLIDELTWLQGTLSPEEKHLASLISGTVKKLEKMSREEFKVFSASVVPPKKPLHFDLGL